MRKTAFWLCNLSCFVFLYSHIAFGQDSFAQIRDAKIGSDTFSFHESDFDHLRQSALYQKLFQNSQRQVDVSTLPGVHHETFPGIHQALRSKSRQIPKDRHSTNLAQHLKFHLFHASQMHVLMNDDLRSYIFEYTPSGFSKLYAQDLYDLGLHEHITIAHHQWSYLKPTDTGDLLYVLRSHQQTFEFIEVPETQLYVMTTPITQAQFLAVTGTNPSKFKDQNWQQHPVERVRSSHVEAFLKTINTELSQRKIHHHARLFTTQEWLQIADLNAPRDFYNQADDYAHTIRTKPFSTRPVRSKRQGLRGLWMFGNVAEWTSTTSVHQALYLEARAVCGGGWYDNIQRIGPNGKITWYDLENCSDQVGFRMVIPYR